ncbi:aurora kinase A activator-like protein bora [Haematobia irritans]|uniref:aurora kinase A activator-like protein bora n=1 Tax=Haematobia irritans TaxID=7368 RepID=UPI003F508C7D
MENRTLETPQKLKAHRFLINYQQNLNLQTPEECKVTPKNKQRKSINPRSPKSTAGQGLSYSMNTCSMMSNSGGAGGSSSNSLHSVSMAIIQTPPAKRHQKVKNPFEAAWTERLHMPIIASPSLFQRPDTPQMSSTQCEWTIDEVSSMMPANVEPHETQFHDSPDPELEAKAQSAISSYFKENQIVPSPVDCPLRSQRIVLSDSGNTPISKPGRRIRDCASQTELTLPPVLPPALEEALRPYLQPHLAGANIELKKSRYASRSSASSCSLDAKDTSLRRKLFDIHNVLIWENEQQKKNNSSSGGRTHSGQSNSSPLSLQSLQHTAIVGKLSDSLDKSSFGSLSPISAADELSPSIDGGERKSRFNDLRSEIEDLEQLSPIHPPVRRKPLEKLYRSQNKENLSNDMITGNISQEAENEKFTPERSSSPLASMITNNIAEFSSDSFNIKVSRLKVNSSKSLAHRGYAKHPLRTITNEQMQEVDVFLGQDETCEDVLEFTGDIEDMQISQVSTHSSNCSSSQSDTPRSKRRSASRKNLSQSFSANWLNDEDDQEDNEAKKSIMQPNDAKPSSLGKPVNSSSFGGIVHHHRQTSPTAGTSPKKALTFYRTDSGFNEMSQNSSESQDCQQMHPPPLNDQQIMVHCCSTPSTKDKFDFR